VGEEGRRGTRIRRGGLEEEEEMALLDSNFAFAPRDR
jgi:hypothetical protein